MPQFYPPNTKQTIIQLSLEDIEELRTIVQAEVERRYKKPRRLAPMDTPIGRISHQIETRYQGLRARIWEDENETKQS